MPSSACKKKMAYRWKANLLKKNSRSCCPPQCFFFNDTATTEIYTLSLHDALPIYSPRAIHHHHRAIIQIRHALVRFFAFAENRSEEHTSELQSQFHLVCRLLLEKKKNKILIFLLLQKTKNKKQD